MVSFALCSLVVLILLAAVLIVGLSQTTHRLLTGPATIVIVSFVLSAMLGFVFTNDLLRLPGPIVLAAGTVIAGAVLLELAQFAFVRKKAAVRDILLVLAGVCLFVLSRAVMHAIGMNIVDQFEVFVD